MEYSSKAMVVDESATKAPHDWNDHVRGRQMSALGEDSGLIEADVHELNKGLSGFHTSMIAIGGAIGAGLFVSVGGAFAQGGPASVLIGFIIIGTMMV